MYVSPSKIVRKIQTKYRLLILPQTNRYITKPPEANTAMGVSSSENCMENFKPNLNCYCCYSQLCISKTPEGNTAMLGSPSKYSRRIQAQHTLLSLLLTNHCLTKPSEANIAMYISSSVHTMGDLKLLCTAAAACHSSSHHQVT